MCVSAQAIDISFVDGEISFIPSHSKNTTVEIFSDTNAVMHLNITMLPDGEGFNLSYPETITLVANQMQTITVIISTSIFLMPGNYTMNISYVVEFEEPESNPPSGGSSSNPHIVVYEPEPEAPLPVIKPPPDPDDPDIPPSPTPDGSTCTKRFTLPIFHILFLIGAFLILLGIIILNKRSKTKKEQTKNEKKNK